MTHTDVVPARPGPACGALAQLGEPAWIAPRRSAVRFRYAPPSPLYGAPSPPLLVVHPSWVPPRRTCAHAQVGHAAKEVPPGITECPRCGRPRGILRPVRYRPRGRQARRPVRPSRENAVNRVAEPRLPTWTSTIRAIIVAPTLVAFSPLLYNGERERVHPRPRGAGHTHPQGRRRNAFARGAGHEEGDENMKVLIVGAGMQGQVLTWNLGRNPAVTEIVVADYDEKRAAFVAGQVGNGKALSMFINAVRRRRCGDRRRGLQARRERGASRSSTRRSCRPASSAAPPTWTWRRDRRRRRPSTRPTSTR